MLNGAFTDLLGCEIDVYRYIDIFYVLKTYVIQPLRSICLLLHSTLSLFLLSILRSCLCLLPVGLCATYIMILPLWGH